MRKKAQPGHLKINIFFIAFFFVTILISCGPEKNSEPDDAVIETVAINVPEFNKDSAYAFIQAQVDFGPRVPGTDAHKKCESYLVSKLESFGAEVMVQRGIVRAYNGKDLPLANIIASFNPTVARRVLLCAHWDTRPVADQDDKDQNKPIPGANDGGSGVGVLLEIARILANNPVKIGIDIVLFDVEDHGQPDDSGFKEAKDSWCLGSQYWSKTPHKPGYFAAYGILLDMVGAKGATFTKEEGSMYYAPSIVEKVWKTAEALGYGDIFINKRTPSIIDDHYYVNGILGIPTIDIIHNDANTKSNFFPHWHKHTDDMSQIDPEILDAVGKTLLHVIYSE